jgi:tetratricopeptide (TPR) repeat protein
MKRTERALITTALLSLALPVQADEAKALKYLKAGISLYDAKDWEAARQAFLQAHNEAPDKANPYRWLGLTEAHRGNCTDAIGYFDEFLKRAKPDDERRAEVMQEQAKCRTEIANAPPGAVRPVDIGAVLQRSPPPPAPPEKTKRKKVGRWIWGVIAGSAAAAGGITAGIVVGTTHDPVPSQGSVSLGGN